MWSQESEGRKAAFCARQGQPKTSGRRKETPLKNAGRTRRRARYAPRARYRPRFMRRHVRGDAPVSRLNASAKLPGLP